MDYDFDILYLDYYNCIWIIVIVVSVLSIVFWVIYAFVHIKFLYCVIFGVI